MDNDEIDLGELFRTLWAYKFLIAVVTSLGVFGAGYHALNADKEYTASAVFSIESEGSKGFSLGGELSGIAALAGINAGGSSGVAATLERVKRREFILEASQTLGFEGDPNFNTYDADAIDPLWKSLIKRAIGWQKSQQAKEAIVEQNILKNYGELVSVSEIEGGALQLTVVNSNPEYAARYANALMDMIAKMVDSEQEQANSDRLAYLSDILAKSLTDVEQTQEDLANFSLKNGVSPEQNLLSESSNLDRLRRERQDAEAFIDAIAELSDLVAIGDTTDAAFTRLRAAHPVVDDVRFRRILGMSETVNSWSWPSETSLEQVGSTLSNRLTRLDVELAELSGRAADTAEQVEELADLKRKATIAEATYRVMIEQVKAQTLSAGYKPETFKVYQYAVPPIVPSAPKRSLIVALGLVLGLFFGAAMALILGLRRGVHFSATALERHIDADMSLSVKRLRRLSRLPLDVIQTRLQDRSLVDLEEATIQLANEKLIIVTSLRARVQGAGVARLLAASAAKSGKRVLLCDTSWQSVGSQGNTLENDYETLTVIEGVDVIFPGSKNKSSNIFARSDFISALKTKIANYDQVIVTGRDELALSSVRSLSALEPAHVLSARVGGTKKLDVEKIVRGTNVKVLFYE